MTEYEKLLTEATAAILNATPGVIVTPELRHLRSEDFPAWILAEARQALADAPIQEKVMTYVEKLKAQTDRLDMAIKESGITDQFTINRAWDVFHAMWGASIFWDEKDRSIEFVKDKTEIIVMQREASAPVAPKAS